MCDILKSLVRELHYHQRSSTECVGDKVICLCNHCLYSYDVHGDRSYFEEYAETVLYHNFISSLGNSWVDQLDYANSYSEKVSTCLSHQGLRGTMEHQIDDLIIGCSCVGRKNLDRSFCYIKRASKAFERQNYVNALRYVNKALRLVPRSDEIEDDMSKDALSLAFGCRSHIYSKLELFYESFLDKVDALKFAFSDEIKQSLISSLDQMRGALIFQFGPSVMIGLDLPPSDPFDVSEFDTLNGDIDGAAESLFITWELNKGRSIRTRTPRKTLDTVLVEEPYAVWLISELYSKYCANCLRSLDHRFIPCQGCIYLRYCSVHCCEENWKLCHSSECYYMAVFKDFSIGFLAFKVILIAGVDHALSEYKSRMKNDCIKYTYKASMKNCFSDILTLWDRKDRDNLSLASTICSATYLSLFAKAMGLIKEDSLIDLGGLILNLCMIIDSNSLPITNELRQKHTDLEPNDFHDSVVGVGLYATASLLNHSCFHNCEPLFIGSKLQLITNRAIRQNEELNITYGCNALLFNYDERKNWLREKALFKCYCDICKLQL